MHHEPRSFSIPPSTNQLILRDFITYVVKGDPEAKEIKIPALAAFYFVDDAGARMKKVDFEVKGREKGEEGAAIESVEIYLDASEVFARIQGVKNGTL
ncbi:hypothetical protein EG329_006921 [Mollisiaceae sp. DMI_Dod_QoI]|nr:hypothetical protein EG329_006921 [Helotiales sp. DMI_Dod_QoI]